MLLLRFISEPQNLVTAVVFVALALAITACLLAARGYSALARFVVVRSILLAVLPALAGTIVAYIGSCGGGDAEARFIGAMIGFFAGWIGVLTHILVASVRSFRVNRPKLLSRTGARPGLSAACLTVLIPAAIWTGSWLVGWICPVSIVAHRALHGPRALEWLEVLDARGTTAAPALLTAMQEYRLSLGSRSEVAGSDSVICCFNWLLRVGEANAAEEMGKWLMLKSVSHRFLSELVRSASAGRVQEVAPEISALLRVPDTELGYLHGNVLQALAVLGASDELCAAVGDAQCDKYTRHRAALILMKLAPGRCVTEIRSLAGMPNGGDDAVRIALRKVAEVEDKKKAELVQRCGYRPRSGSQR